MTWKQSIPELIDLAKIIRGANIEKRHLTSQWAGLPTIIAGFSVISMMIMVI